MDENRFFDSLRKYAKEELSETRQVALAKKEYLVKNKALLLKAVEVGYDYPLIAKVATAELLESMDIPRVFKRTDKEGIEIEVASEIKPFEIRKFLESEIDHSK